MLTETADPTPLELDGLDLAALVASRVCHDVISPVGAIVNGLEVLDEGDEDTKAFALDLIRKSARTASARLQFCRIAFGAAGSAGAEIDTGDAEAVARGMIEDDKIKIAWELPRRLLPKNRVKLLLNMMLLATHAVPRGGRLTLSESAEGFAVRAEGPSARVPPHVPDLVAGRAPGGRVDAHAIQPFYAGLLARAVGLPLAVETEGEAIVLRARGIARTE